MKPGPQRSYWRAWARSCLRVCIRLRRILPDHDVAERHRRAAANDRHAAVKQLRDDSAVRFEYTVDQRRAAPCCQAYCCHEQAQQRRRPRPYIRKKPDHGSAGRRSEDGVWLGASAAGLRSVCECSFGAADGRRRVRF